MRAYHLRSVSSDIVGWVPIEPLTGLRGVLVARAQALRHVSLLVMHNNDEITRVTSQDCPAGKLPEFNFQGELQSNGPISRLVRSLEKIRPHQSETETGSRKFAYENFICELRHSRACFFPGA